MLPVNQKGYFIFYWQFSALYFTKSPNRTCPTPPLAEDIQTAIFYEPSYQPLTLI